MFDHPMPSVFQQDQLNLERFILKPGQKHLGSGSCRVEYDNKDKFIKAQSHHQLIIAL